jgi:hypothetical protein
VRKHEASHMRKYVFHSTGQQFDRDKVTNYNKSKGIRIMASAENQDFTTRSYLQVLRDGLIPIMLETDIY